MSSKYIIRLDDASEYMNFEKWNPYFKIFEQYNIFPIIAVIPCNRDPKMLNSNPDKNFWDKVRDWQKKNYVIALHGYEHLYSNANPGIMGINKYSEFAGINLQTQISMLQNGLAKFNSEDIYTNMFVAPAHSFDKNTIKALIYVGINYISDGFFLNPIFKNGINWIPQQLWKPIKKNKGVWTICVHPETESEAKYYEIKNFIENNLDNFSHPLNVKINSKMSISDLFFKYYLSKRYCLVKIKNRFIN